MPSVGLQTGKISIPNVRQLKTGEEHMLTKRVMILFGALIGGFILSVFPLALANSSQARLKCPQVDAGLEDDEDNCSPDQPKTQTQISMSLLTPTIVISGFELFVGTGESGLPSNNPPSNRRGNPAIRNSFAFRIRYRRNV
jgi:hypothetical protein